MGAAMWADQDWRRSGVHCSAAEPAGNYSERERKRDTQALAEQWCSTACRRDVLGEYPSREMNTHADTGCPTLPKGRHCLDHEIAAHSASCKKPNVHERNT